MNRVIRRITWGKEEDQARLIDREWIVTNGLGGYASGTISGVITRRYHGLLIAALPAPLGRTVMFNDLSEQFRLPDGTVIKRGGQEFMNEQFMLNSTNHLVEFRLEDGIPIWRYQFGEYVVERLIFLVHEQNTVHIQYRLVQGDGKIRLKLRPSLHFRGHEEPVNLPLEEHYVFTATDSRYQVSAGRILPPLRMLLYGNRTAFTVETKRMCSIFYRIEESRGYECTGDLWTPGYFRATLSPDQETTLVASTEAWDAVECLHPDDALTAERIRKDRLFSGANPKALSGIPAELVLAADQFIITPSGRAEDTARARAAGDEVRSVIAGYHWFTDWGRDTMISLEGLTLITGRYAEAGYILRTFAHYVRDGLIPNMFPEGNKEGLYHTADATLWFFHAIDRYLNATKDFLTLRTILPKLFEIIDCHIRGTSFGIGIDPEDGLLRQGAQGYQLTWMDAKVGDWVVTPRRGKAVEINALWYNALCLMEKWVRGEQGDAEAAFFKEQAVRVYESFNKKFWFAEGSYLYDVIDDEYGNNAAFRPNQLFAISLPHPVLDPSKWDQVLYQVEQRLLTPVGLRSLAPGHPDYKPKYYGDLRSRDAAYHQGTVWGWLIGPFVDAWLKVFPGDYARARRFLEGFEYHLSEAGIGTISEVFDADPPFNPGGCIAQAWSVAEVLRCWVKTENSLTL